MIRHPKHINMADWTIESETNATFYKYFQIFMNINNGCAASLLSKSILVLNMSSFASEW